MIRKRLLNKRMNIRMSDELFNRVHKEAYKQGLDASTLVRLLLDKMLWDKTI